MHVLEVRHASFLVPEFVALMRKHEVAIVYANSDEYPAIADVTAPFAYLRLQRTAEDDRRPAIRRATSTSGRSGRRLFAAGGEPDDLPRFGDRRAAKKKRDVFVYMISGAKVRAPAAAMALIERVK